MAGMVFRIAEKAGRDKDPLVLCFEQSADQIDQSLASNGLDSAGYNFPLIFDASPGVISSQNAGHDNDGNIFRTVIGLQLTHNTTARTTSGIMTSVIIKSGNCSIASSPPDLAIGRWETAS